VVAFVRGWDLAATSKKKNPRAAFTVGVKVGVCADGTVFIADVKREKADAARVEAMIEETARMDGPAVRISLPQDPGQAGVAQILSYARKLQGYQVFGSPESGDKALRAIAISAQVGAGNVACLRATWTDSFLAEMRLFPASTYKDQVDALSRAYTELVMVSPQPKTRVAPQWFGG
jgi:predicted phage terminase large subunit-like protein